MAPASSAPRSPWRWGRLVRRRGADAGRDPQPVQPVTSTVGHDAWQEPLRAGAVAAWVRLRADQHLTEVEQAVRRLRQQAATEVAVARVESERLRRVAADHAVEIIDRARNEAESQRARTDDEARRRLAEVESEIVRWLRETEAEAAVIAARAEERALTLVKAAETERDAIVAAAAEDRAALLADARQAEEDLNTVLGLIEDLLAEAEEETTERRRLACLAADEIIAAARAEAGRSAGGAWPGPPRGGTDEIAARRLRTEQELHRRIS